MSINPSSRFENAALQFYTDKGKVEDLTPREDIKRIYLSEYSISLPEGTGKLGAFIQEHQEYFNCVIKNLLSNSNSNQDDVSIEKRHLIASFVQLLAQDALNVYAYNKEDREDYINTHIDNLKMRYEQIENYIKDHPTTIEEDQEAEFVNYFAFQECKEYFRPENWAHLFDGVQGIDNLRAFLGQLTNRILESKEFAAKVEESDRKFFEKHFTTLKNISNEEVRSLYLSTLPQEHLKWLDRLTVGTDKTSLYIKAKVKEIHESEEFVNQIASVALVTIFSGAMLTLNNFSSPGFF